MLFREKTATTKHTQGLEVPQLVPRVSEERKMLSLKEICAFKMSQPTTNTVIRVEFQYVRSLELNNLLSMPLTST